MHALLRLAVGHHLPCGILRSEVRPTTGLSGATSWSWSHGALFVRLRSPLVDLALLAPRAARRLRWRSSDENSTVGLALQLRRTTVHRIQVSGVEACLSPHVRACRAAPFAFPPIRRSRLPMYLRRSRFLKVPLMANWSQINSSGICWTSREIVT